MAKMTPAAPHLPRFKGEIGIARRDITPPVGIYSRNWGAALDDVATGVHKPFFATAVVIRPEAGPTLVLAAVDGGWWQSQEDEWRIRRAIIEESELDISQVMIAFSHSHAGPSLASGNRGKLGGEHIEPYLAMMSRAVAEATSEALERLQPAIITWATGRSDLAVNRNLKDPEGERYLTGYNPGAAADDTLLVGRVTNARGDPLGTLVNYACHPTTLAWENRLLSPDYVGAMRELVEAHTGNAPCAFLLGACGELAPAHQYSGDVGVADSHGRRLGHSVCATLEGMPGPEQELVFTGPVESGAPLAVWRPQSLQLAASRTEARYITVPLEIKPDFPTAAAIKRDREASRDRVIRERLARKLRIRELLGDAQEYPFPVWIWKAGDTLFVGTPGEAYSDLQQALRTAFPDLAVVVMNIINGSIGYLPPDKLYDRDLYEVWQTPFQRGSYERLLEGCLDTIKGLILR